MKKILYIEDDAVIRENIAELLELANYKVLTAANGKLGIEKAKKKLPDIIICDILMPELDGYSVLDILSKNNKTKFIPFVFLSAKTKKKDIRKGMNLGADDYITKPFTEEELISTLESRLAKAAILKEERDKFKRNTHTDDDEMHSLNDLKIFFDDNGVQLTYKNGDNIYREGDNSNLIFLINKGAVKCFKLDEQGKELTTELYKEDDLFGYTSFNHNIPYQETATAIKDLEMVGISKNELLNVLNSNHKVTLEIIELLTDNLHLVKNQLMQMAYSTVNKKTASTIIKFAEKLNRKPEDPFRISRSDLASVAGIATETLIRTMTIFKKQGLIEIEGRDIKILDLQKLRDIY